MSDVLITTAIAVLVYVSIGWTISAVLKRADVVDPFWGPGFAVVALVCAVLKWSEIATQMPNVLLLMAICIWGLRLGLHLAIRWWGEEHEDRRYARLRAAGSKLWWLRSLITIFYLQGVILWLVSLPLQYGLAGSESNFGPLFYIGLSIWAVGLFFEAVGDWQLTQFRSRPENSGQVLNSGLWRYTRHPNYFGDFAVWWGLFFMSLHCGAPIWTVFAPIIMSALLMKFSGVGILEKDISSRRPGYEQYVRETNTFWPWFRRQTKVNK